MVVSILGLIGRSATDELLKNLEDVAPGPAQEILSDAIRNLQGSGSASGIAFVIGIVAAIWAASGYVNGFMSASNAIYAVEEGRPMTKTLPVRVGLTLVLMVLAVVIAFAVTLTGGIASEVGSVLGVGDGVVQVWGLAKWPVLLLLVSLLLALLYWGTPNVKLRFRIISPGALVAVAGLGARVGGLCLLRRELQLLQQDLRSACGPDRVPAVAVDLEHLHPARGRAQRRARAQPQARVRRGLPRGRAVRRDARHGQARRRGRCAQCAGAGTRPRSSWRSPQPDTSAHAASSTRKPTSWPCHAS